MHPPFHCLASAAPSALARLWWLLTRPAVVDAPGGGGGAWPIGQRLLLERRLNTLSSSLASVLDTPVTMRWSSAARSVRQAFVLFARVAGSGAEADRPIAIGLDSALARTIVDAISLRFAGLRGQGRISDAEMGLLEFVILTVADGLHADGERVIIDRFMAARDLAAERPECPGDPLRVQVNIGARSGLMTIWSDALPTEPAAIDMDLLPSDIEREGTIVLEATLPPIALTPDEMSCLRPGDVVLSSVSDISAAPLWLRCATGWRIARASLERLSPTLAILETEPPLPTPIPDQPAGETEVECMITFARLELSYRKFAELTPRLGSGQVDLPMVGPTPARLYAGGRLLAEGELLDADGQTAFRVCSCRQG